VEAVGFAPTFLGAAAATLTGAALALSRRPAR